MTARKTSKRLTLLFRVAFTVIVGFGALAAAADKPKPVPAGFPQRYERVTDPSLYVGAETCKTCHEDIFKNFETTPHFVTTLENKRGPEWQGLRRLPRTGQGTW